MNISKIPATVATATTSPTNHSLTPLARTAPDPQPQLPPAIEQPAHIKAAARRLITSESERTRLTAMRTLAAYYTNGCLQCVREAYALYHDAPSSDLPERASMDEHVDVLLGCIDMILDGDSLRLSLHGYAVGDEMPSEYDFPPPSWKNPLDDIGANPPHGTPWPCNVTGNAEWDASIKQSFADMCAEILERRAARNARAINIPRLKARVTRLFGGNEKVAVEYVEKAQKAGPAALAKVAEIAYRDWDNILPAEPEGALPPAGHASTGAEHLCSCRGAG